MGAGWILGAGSHWAGALLVTLTVLRTHLAHCMELPRRVVIQAKFGCHFTNGTERVRFLHRHIYNRQQIAHFDSDLGVYVGDTELGRPDAEYWNKDPAILADRRALVDTFCRHNYGTAQVGKVVGRTAGPFHVPVSEAQSDSARSKMLTGVGGFVLGLIFLAPGLLIYLKNKKGHPVPQPAGLLS
nr:HLA class II histocompatibility antigen, DR beta 5 chain-like [Chelonoidis abingdonii]